MLIGLVNSSCISFLIFIFLSFTSPRCSILKGFSLPLVLIFKYIVKVPSQYVCFRIPYVSNDPSLYIRGKIKLFKKFMIS